MVDGKVINVDVLKLAVIQEQWELPFVLEKDDSNGTVRTTELSVSCVKKGCYYFVTINGNAAEENKTELKIQATYFTESSYPVESCRLHSYFNNTTVNGQWIGNMSSKRELAIRCLDILEDVFVDFQL